MENYQKNLLYEYIEISSFVTLLRSSNSEISPDFALDLGTYHGIIAQRIKMEGVEIPSSAGISITYEEFKNNFDKRLKNLEAFIIEGCMVANVSEKDKREILLEQYVTMCSLAKHL